MVSGASPKHAATSLHVRCLQELVEDGRVVLLGPIRQELLSGVRHAAQFERLREKLRAFPDARIEVEDHEDAAEFFNTCMASGIQGSTTDYLICAYAARRKLPILTTDRDFPLYARHLPIQLLAV